MTTSASTRRPERAPAWRSWLEQPLSGVWCVIGWLASTALFVGIVQLVGGPTKLDSELTTGSTWAIAHGQLSCAFPSNAPSVAPLYPMLSGGAAAAARLGRGAPFPSAAALGHSCGKAHTTVAAWSVHAHALPGTLRIAYIAWVVLLIGIVALLRASERGRSGWEPATLVVVACLPPVWMCVAGYFHPQDLLAMGLALGALACARREAWVGAGILIALALLSQQFAALVAVPMLVVAPMRRRIHFVLAVLATVVVVTLPLLFTGGRHIVHGVLLGSGNTGYDDGTLIGDLHLGGSPLFLASRVLPLALSLLVALWVLRRLGSSAALGATLFTSLIALSLSLRLIFEPSLYGYYFMALAVALVLLDVIADRIRSGLVAWLLVVSLAYTVGPNSFVLFERVSWGHAVRAVLPPSVLVLALVLALAAAARHRSRRAVAVWLGLALGAALAWISADDLFFNSLTTLGWQLLLVTPGILLAGQPLYTRACRHGEMAPSANAGPVPGPG